MNLISRRRTVFNLHEFAKDVPVRHTLDDIKFHSRVIIIINRATAVEMLTAV